ncbi:MAG: tRNA (adenosine(37)-N6)-threonylcarbamoyltransferase complex transferase subunit TsaD [Candidatus Pacebacteria bacterium]|nr:tRNA (adenosine(37)-N6)-threonylcarbamoyltransferase complex transferase subunit TsaD [Candidatus Paceibacterota bacterium]
MKILAIETSCDETAISIVDARGGFAHPTFTILGNQLLSQASMHAKYGGVFPNLAKREHSKNILPLCILALKEAKLFEKSKKTLNINEKERAFYKELLTREHDIIEPFIKLLSQTKKPKIDAVAVTAGPGLEPALWVGINFAKALSHAWNVPLLPINHMEGHIVASLLQKGSSKKEIILPKITFPALALLISGGHTELVLMKDRMKYKKIGSTRDDAIGEAFDKVARMMNFPYPGGPHISKLAKTIKDGSSRFPLPRPMLHSNDFDFSFSGIKTAVLYTIKKIPRLTPKMKAEIANEFELAVTEVLIKKTLGAAQKYKVRTILIGGGVSANERIRNTFTKKITAEFPNIKLYLPTKDLSTDNALMIATSAYFRSLSNKKGAKNTKNIRAKGNLSL